MDCKIKIQNFVEVDHFIIFTPDLPVRNRNCEESLTENISADSPKNNQLTNTTPMKNSALLKEGIYRILMISPFFIINYENLLIFTLRFCGQI